MSDLFAVQQRAELNTEFHNIYGDICKLLHGEDAEKTEFDQRLQVLADSGLLGAIERILEAILKMVGATHLHTRTYTYTHTYFHIRKNAHTHTRAHLHTQDKKNCQAVYDMVEKQIKEKKT